MLLPPPFPQPPSSHQHSCSSIIEELQLEVLRLKGVGVRAPYQASVQELCPGDGTPTPTQKHVFPYPLPSLTPHVQPVLSKSIKSVLEKVGQKLSQISQLRS